MTATKNNNNTKILIVGLGNPGAQYEKTRHNVGFMLVDEMVKESWKEEKKFKALVARSADTIFAKPLTFMNLSGEAVSKIASFYKIEPQNIVVIHDEVDFPFLEWKLQLGKDSAGHKGVEDIMERLGTQAFWRVRVGVGRPEQAQFGVEAYVLSNMNEEDLPKVAQLSDEILTKIENNFSK